MPPAGCGRDGTARPARGHPRHCWRESCRRPCLRRRPIIGRRHIPSPDSQRNPENHRILTISPRSGIIGNLESWSILNMRGPRGGCEPSPGPQPRRLGRNGFGKPCEIAAFGNNGATNRRHAQAKRWGRLWSSLACRQGCACAICFSMSCMPEPRVLLPDRLSGPRADPGVWARVAAARTDRTAAIRPDSRQCGIPRRSPRRRHPPHPRRPALTD